MCVFTVTNTDKKAILTLRQIGLHKITATKIIMKPDKNRLRPGKKMPQILWTDIKWILKYV